MAYLSCLIIAEKNNFGVCIIDEGAKKVSSAFLVNAHISCSITVITLPWATAFFLIDYGHPTNVVPSSGLSPHIFLYVQ